jgi:hypothetical protein
MIVKVAGKPVWMRGVVCVTFRCKIATKLAIGRHRLTKQQNYINSKKNVLFIMCNIYAAMFISKKKSLVTSSWM